MTSSLRLLELPGSLFQKDGPNSSKLISFLTTVINDGYEVNKKYNIITSTRIKHEAMFISDLGFYNPDSFILVLLKPKNLSDTAILPQLLSHDICIEKQDLAFNFDEISKDQILGTIGVKILEEQDETGWELTGFISNFKGVGKYLINRLTSLANAAKQPELLASVIYEHNLVQYYGQFGFEEYGERSLQKINEDGLVTGGTLEDEIYATQDFHVAFLKKQL